MPHQTETHLFPLSRAFALLLLVEPRTIKYILFSVRAHILQAYKMRQANSVKIAKIAAIAVVASSFIIGCFILAATYMQSRAVCDQISSLQDALAQETLMDLISQVSHLKFPI